MLVTTTPVCLLVEIRFRFATTFFLHGLYFFHKLAAENPRCENRVVWRTVAVKTNKTGHFCDPHIPRIAMLPVIQRFYAKCTIEDRSNSVFLEKFHFSRFHLQVYGLKQS